MTTHIQEDLFGKEAYEEVKTTSLSASRPGTKDLNAVCLFSSAGIGELGVERAGIKIKLANEIIPLRASCYKNNFKNGEMLEGDIKEVKEEFIVKTKELLQGDDLFLLYATPPCQGMSSNGMGRLKWEISQGRRLKEDERNRLIMPAVDIIKALKPTWVIFENVPGMRNTEIRTHGNHFENVLDYLTRSLGDEYLGRAEIVACQDYGIPQLRKRLVTIFTRDENGKKYFKSNGGSFFSPKMKEKRQSLRDAIGHLPALDATQGNNAKPDFHPQHYVPIMNKMKYEWVDKTREGDTAFNNQCANPECGYSKNPGHKDIQVNGKWVSSKEIPIHCQKCGELLPRPVVKDKEGNYRLLKGFHSAYRRMKWDEPARTLTQNFIYEASDNKIHPDQNRVLSIYEAMVVQTIDRYNYSFEALGKPMSTSKIAEVIGESVPPYLIEKICKMMIEVSNHEC
ncbi:DNA cytosine methyltransferase [Halomonas sp. CKK8]|uniref:DNA cytosine methyltransferase n=1 Tax=Halomonas sp. CKK8 TaxID=3036127 RepID=UPI0024158FAD|nr:DNA cytosine methyltransferase [Halomonas sp. CKK8]WFM70985.1 DNA cytosine methyltransferase [Halomonas sp. CKK8]